MNTRSKQITILAVMMIALAVLTSPALATTSVTVTKYDAYGAVLNTTTVDIDYMENSTELPVYGDGSTHYFFHGPTFDQSSYDALWDPDENDNVLSRDYGAVKGTDVRDLCNLVGGMDVNDYVQIKAEDSFTKSFDYDDVYTPDPDAMRMVLCWYNGEESIYGESQGVGYPPDYFTGMRLHIFADTSVNPWGFHVFGIWDMHENLAPNRWHYYYDGSLWPSSSGLSVKWVDRVEIYQPNLISCDASGNPVDSFASGETVYVKGLGLSANTDYKLWIQDEPVLKSPLDALDRPTGSYFFSTENDPSDAQETVTTDSNGDFGPVAVWSPMDAVGNYDILDYDIVADNQASGTVGKFDNKDHIDNPGGKGFDAVAAPVPPVANFSANVTSGVAPLIVSFTDLSTYEPTNWSWTFGDGGNSTAQNPVHEYTTVGNYTVTLNATNAYGSDEEVKIDYITVREGVCGDVNNDDRVTMGDGRRVYMNLLYGDAEYPIENPWAADVNCDERITMGDGRKIYMNLLYGAAEYPLECCP